MRPSPTAFSQDFATFHTFLANLLPKSDQSLIVYGKCHRTVTSSAAAADEPTLVLAGLLTSLRLKLSADPITTDVVPTERSCFYLRTRHSRTDTSRMLTAVHLLVIVMVKFH